MSDDEQSDARSDDDPNDDDEQSVEEPSDAGSDDESSHHDAMERNGPARTIVHVEPMFHDDKLAITLPPHAQPGDRVIVYAHWSDNTPYKFQMTVPQPLVPGAFFNKVSVTMPRGTAPSYILGMPTQLDATVLKGATIGYAIAWQAASAVPR